MGTTTAAVETTTATAEERKEQTHIEKSSLKNSRSFVGRMAVIAATADLNADGHNPYAAKTSPIGENPRNFQQKYLPSTICTSDNWSFMEAQQKKGRPKQQYGGMSQQQ